MIQFTSSFLSYPPLDVQIAREKSFNITEAKERGVKFAERIEIEVSEEVGQVF